MKAQVHQGRLVLDEPTSLPEGTELHLTIVDEADELTEEERGVLDAELMESWAQAVTGQVSSAEQVLTRLRARR